MHSISKEHGLKYNKEAELEEDTINGSNTQITVQWKLMCCF